MHRPSSAVLILPVGPSGRTFPAPQVRREFCRPRRERQPWARTLAALRRSDRQGIASEASVLRWAKGLLEWDGFGDPPAPGGALDRSSSRRRNDIFHLAQSAY